MICERPYLSVFTPDPEDVCFRCDGRGFVADFGRERGYTIDPCPICDGVATGGAFVVHVVTDRFQHEFNYQADSLDAAARKAERTAELFATRKCLGHVVREVRVVYKPFDRTDRERIVHVEPGRTHGPVAA